MDESKARPFDKKINVTHDLPVADSNARLDALVGAADRNQLRAMWASVGVRAYAARVGLLTSEDAETAIGDLLCDMRHLCDALGVDFDERLKNSLMHYEAEVGGED